MQRKIDTLNQLLANQVGQQSVNELLTRSLHDMCQTLDAKQTLLKETSTELQHANQQVFAKDTELEEQHRRVQELQDSLQAQQTQNS